MEKYILTVVSISSDGLTITDFTSLTVGDLILSGEVITSKVTNGNMHLNSNGSGKVHINSVSISPEGEIEGAKTITDLDSIEVGEMTFSGKIITNNVTDSGIHLITNGSGKVHMNNVSISLDGEIEGAKTITDLDSIEVGDLTFGVNVITTNKTNGDIQLSTEGSGKVYINGVSISANGKVEGKILLIHYLPKAYCNFDDTLVDSTHTIAVRDQANVSSVTGSAGNYHIEFAEHLNNDNYGVIITLGTSGGTLPFISNAYYVVKQTGSVTIVVTNASGELVSECPHGVTVMIMSAS
jgi:hypothetical protein